jgi:hypothetical protein
MPACSHLRQNEYTANYYHKAPAEASPARLASGWHRAGRALLPFLAHSDLNHLYNNSMPLLVLLAAFNFTQNRPFL